MNIALPDIPPEGQRHLDAPELYRIVQAFVKHRLVEMDPDDLCALDEWEDEDTRKLVMEKCRYELREAQPYYSEAGLVGRATARQFAGIVHYSFDHAVKAFSYEQPGCDWQLVAAEVSRVNLKQTVEVPFEGDVMSEADPAKWVRSKTSVALERTVGHMQVPDYRCVVRMVFADIGRGEINDPATYSAQGQEGPMTRYARSRLLRHLTPGQRKNRAESIALIQRMYARQEAPPPLNEAHMADQSDELAALKRRIRELEADRGPVVPVPEVEPAGMVSDDLAARIVEMRTSGQMAPGAIAKALADYGVTIADVKTVLARPGG